MSGEAPKWLRKLERRLGWLAVPNIAILLVTLQAMGFLFVLMDPVWHDRLALLPWRVTEGEVWRLLTFLALPLTLHPLFMIFALLFLYFIVTSIESEWGAFRTTLYVLVSLFVTIVFSLATGYPVTQARHFESSLFLAAAALYPEMEIRLYFAVPVKLKWLGWLTLAFVLYEFVVTSLLGKLYLLSIYSGFILFFGPALLVQLRSWQRRRDFRRRMR